MKSPVTFPPVQLPPLLLTPEQKKWRHNEYFIRMGGVAVIVDVDYDRDSEGFEQHTQSRVRVVVHGECPDCAINKRADAAEFSHEFVAAEVEYIRCDCGAAWHLQSGVPEEYR